VLAPHLFNFYLEATLMSQPTHSNKYIHHELLAYADDLIVKFAKHRGMRKTIAVPGVTGVGLGAHPQQAQMRDPWTKGPN
jgi:hypothetical protein